MTDRNLYLLIASSAANSMPGITHKLMAITETSHKNINKGKGKGKVILLQARCDP